MTRVHCTQKALDLAGLRDAAQDKWLKPRGLWWSVDHAWRRWCEHEMPGWLEGARDYEVVLAPGARVLALATPSDVRAFTAEYALRGVPDWARVAAAGWDGFEAPAYYYSLRHGPESLWYYALDVPSGCVWNARAVAALNPIEAPPYGAGEDA